MTRLIALVLGLAVAAAAQAHTPLASSLPAADASVAAPKTWSSPSAATCA